MTSDSTDRADAAAEEPRHEVLRIDLNGATFYAVAANERAKALADARAEAFAQLKQRAETAEKACIELRDRMAGLRKALRQSRDAIGNVLEWLDGHAAPNVTKTSIERALHEAQDDNARALDEPVTS